MLIRRLLHAEGYRYRLHARGLPGSPDMILPKYRVAIFVDGCFWHGHSCHLFKVPKTRTDFWLEKIQGNKRRDAIKDELLLAQGWRVFRIWECSLRGLEAMTRPAILTAFCDWLKSGDLEGSLPCTTRNTLDTI
jgi:DNA mismatch endonuclease (patch repair protein)